MQQGKARGRLARAAVTAALTGAMALGGVVGPVGTALAADATITFNDASGPVTKSDYNVYVKVFKAVSIDNTRNDDGGLAIGVTWGSDGVKNTIIEFLKQDVEDTGASKSYIQWLVDEHKLQGDNASAEEYRDLDVAGQNVFKSAANAAQYIGEEIKRSNDNGDSYDTRTENPNKPKVTDSASFANKLANELSDDMSNITFENTSDGTKKLKLTDTGYYLLNGTGDAEPMWLPFDAAAGDVDVYEKTKVPTFEKEAYEGTDATDEKKSIIDAGNGEKVTFTLTGTLPKGKKYEKIVFTDTLPSGVTFAKEDDDGNSLVKVSSEGLSTALTENDFDVLYGISDGLDDDNVFTVTYNKSTDGSLDLTNATEDVTITVTYPVTVNDSAGMGESGLNTNSAKFTYGNGQSVGTESQAKIATYAIKIVKVDEDDEGKLLGGADFTIQEFLGEGTTNNEYVQTDGSISTGTNRHFTTAAYDASDAGTVQVNRIDANTYEITEANAPSTDGNGEDKEYEQLKNSFYVTITPTYDQDEGTITALEATVDRNGNTEQIAVAADPETGIVTVTVPNGQSEVRLPITGMTPSQLGTVAGMALVAAGAYMVLRRRQADQA